MLDAGDGHRLYWEICGDPAGIPALFLHGGPGSGCFPQQRRLFDPTRFRAVLFDQRGAGRSRPRAEEDEHDLATNTTGHLIGDIERLRRHVGVEHWIVVGVSWGTTLGLAYAQSHPDRVTGIVLAAVTTTSRREVEWITGDVGALFPEAWARFTNAIPDHLAGLRPVDAYATMLADPDPTLRVHAAEEWCAWEEAHVSIGPGREPSDRYEDPAFRLRFARLVTHYWRNDAFLQEDQLIRNAHLLTGIRGVLIHGRYDVSSPLRTAWELARRWPDAHLEILNEVGHGGAHLTSAIVDALEGFH